MARIKIAIVILESTMASAALGMEEIFGINNRFCKTSGEPSMESTFVSVEEINWIKPTKLISEDDKYDAIIIAPLMSQTGLFTDTSKLSSWLVSQYHKGTLLSSACVGSFFLAATGLLDGKEATTHWMYETLFGYKYPNVKLSSDKLLVETERIITAGGVSAYMDLALYLIEKFHSFSTANSCANLLLVGRGRESQRCYKELSQVLLVQDKEILALLEWMKENRDKELTTSVLAKKIGLQERTFMRRFKRSVGVTPNHYLQSLRVEAAKSLLVETQKSFENITFEVGFNNESSFRRLFKRETSLNPGEYRKKFALKH